MGMPALEQARVLEVVTDKEDGLSPVFGRTQESPRGAERVATLKAFACALSCSSISTSSSQSFIPII
jgi:hypothetical protein